MRTLTFLASVLVVPLALLLFLQWPLREWVQAYSRQANDLGQIVFALYVAVAIGAGSMARTHLAVAAGSAAQSPRWHAWAQLACVVPWALFMLWAAWAPLRDSVRGLERFPETFTPGYFMLQLALGLLLLLVLLQAALAVWRARGPSA